ncbi:MAG TPA: phosphotriesterase [Pricia sp.]|nr:phosphotriesterase [Pricia sp.]
MKRAIFYLILLLFGLFSPLSMAQIMTVNGPIEPEGMGKALIHEHVMVDWIGADSTGYHRWDRDSVVQRVLPYLKALRQYGVDTFLDCTPAFLGRDPYVLKRLSDETGLQIVTNTGFYGAKDNIYIPDTAFKATAKELANQWITEFERGIDSSGIRPGFIKISVDRDSILTDMHEKLIRAAALAHLSSGMTIVSHTGPDAPALAQIDILKKMGVSPEAFVWTHAQSGTMGGYAKAAEQGAWISLDNIGPASETIEWFVKTLSQLKARDLLDHVLLSHDAGWYDVGHPNGGDFRPYSALFTHLIPELRKIGFTQDEIDKLLVKNPRRAYAIRIKRR